MLNKPIVMLLMASAMAIGARADTFTQEYYDYNNGNWRTVTWTYTIGRESYGEWDYGEVTLTAVSGAVGDVVIQPTIEGGYVYPYTDQPGYGYAKKYNVTRIDSNAFSGCTQMTSVTIPSGVREIGSKAFYGCTKMTTVNISSSDLWDISHDAFEGCSSLTSFRGSGDSYSYYKVRNGLLYHYDYDELLLVPPGLTSVQIPEGTKTISYNAFYYCRNLKSISVPRSLCSASSDMFYYSARPSTIYFEPGDGVRVKNMFRSGSYSFSDSVFVQKRGGHYRELYPMSGDGNYNWVIDDTDSYENGGVSYRSASVRNTTTYITFIVENVKSLTWMWKVSSDYDYINCYIDGNRVDWCYSSNWQKFSYEFDSQWTSEGYTYGTHTVKIEYENCGHGNETSDNCAWIDGLIVTNSVAEAPWTSEQREGGRFWITGTTNTTGSVAIPSALDQQSVAGIGDWLFECCSGLTSVTIPEGITDIGIGAFSGCTALRTIDIPTTVCNIGSNVFYGCSNLTNINVTAQNQFYSEYEGSLFTKDGSELLFVPRGIATITIPSSVMRISTNAFSEATSLRTINVGIDDEERIMGLIASSGATVDSFTFKECAMVAFDPNGGTCVAQPQLVVIGECENLPFPTRNGYMFTGWFAARNGGTEMHSAPVSAFNVSGETTFYAQWEPITWLYVGNLDGTLTVTGCCPTAYGNLIIPAAIDGHAVAGIGDRAFYRCTGLSGVTIADGITSIGSEAFGECSSLQEINLPENVEFSGASPFSGTAYLDSQPEGFLVFGKFLLGYKGSCPSSIAIPEGVESICDSAFSGKNISSVTFPTSLKRIGKSAFYNCRMTTLTFPEGLREIDDSAFENIVSLSTVNFPRTLKKIGIYAFAKNSGSNSYAYPIQRVDIEAENLHIGYSAFSCGAFSSYDTAQGYISLRGSGIVVGDYAFSGYKHAYGVTIDLSGVSKVGNYAFSRAGYYQAYRYSDDGLYAQGCVTVTVSDELKEGSTNAFDWAAVGTICVDKTETIFSRSGWLNMFSMRTSSGSPYEGFYCRLKVGGSYVSNLQIPDGCMSVPPYALYGIKLSTISVPASVTNIGDRAFGCTHAAIQFDGEPPECSDTAFRMCQSGTHIVQSVAWTSAIQDGKWNGILMCEGLVRDYESALGGGNDITTLGSGWSDSSWFVQSSDTHDGDRAMRSGATFSQGSFMECTVVGPAEVSFWWKIEESTQGKSGRMYFYAGTSDYDYGVGWTNTHEWVQVTTNFPSGSHTLRWRYGLADRYRWYGDYAVVDQLEIRYDVTFDLGTLGSRSGGGALTQKVRHGTAAVAPVVRAVDGYVFTGWDRSLDRVTGATTFVAQYRELTVREVLNDASLELVNDTTFPWSPIKDTSAGGLASVRSGTISHSQSSSLTLKVQGAGQLSFKWKVSSESGYDKLSVTGDGSSLASAISGSTDWATVTKTFSSAGTHTVVWTYSKDSSASSGSDCGWVTDVVWTPHHVVTFDANGGSVSPSSRTVAGDVAVGSLPTPTRAGHDFLGWYTALTGGSQVTASTVVTADVTYYAHWQIKTYSVTFDLGGRGTRTGGGALAQTVTYQAAAAEPEVEAATGWVFMGWDASFTSVTEAMTVHALYERAPLTVADAAGGGLEWTVGGDVPWFAEWSDEAHDGLHHMRSGVIGNKQTSDLSAVVQGAGIVSFWCRVSSEADDGEVYDGLSFFVDGENRIPYLFGGDIGWTNLTFEITGAGSHTLCWRYEKDKRDAAGEDCAWLDDVIWQPSLFGPRFYIDGNGVLTNVVLNGVTEIVVPDGVTSIAGEVFRDCESLQSVVIPVGVTNIGYRAFSDCRNLTDVTLPEGLTHIWGSAFFNCSSLTNISIPASMVNIGQYAFSWCSGLASVSIPGGVARIREYAFRGCSNLVSVAISDGVTDIEKYAFQRCIGLAEVTIPASVTSVGENAFKDCRNLTSVTFLGNEPSVGTSVFSGVAQNCTAYVNFDSTGWGVAIPGTWNGIGIQYRMSEAQWLAERNLAADSRAANGRTAAECYALGLDPSLATNDFRIVSIELVDGEPKVEWEPKTNRWTGAEIQATLKGAATLEGPWEDVPAGGSPGTARPTLRFFKVVVEVQ